MKRLLMVCAAAMMVAACAASTRIYDLRVEGMTCGETCPVEVRSALESVPGVRSATVDYATQSARIEVDGDRELTTKELDKSFQNKGYFISSMEPASK